MEDDRQVVGDVEVVEDIGLHQREATMVEQVGEVASVTGDEGVDGKDAQTGCAQGAAQVGPDEPGAAGDERRRSAVPCSNAVRARGCGADLHHAPPATVGTADKPSGGSTTYGPHVAPGGCTTLGTRFDEVLIAARRGDDAAWAEIYHDLAGPVLGYLRGQRAPDPEDLLGETMLQVVRDLRRFEGDETGFRSWVFTIAHRRLLDARRSHDRRPSEAREATLLEASLPSVEGAEPEAMAGLERDDVLSVLDRVTESQREVLLLRLLADLDVAQTAEATGRSPDAVKALTKRGLDRLRVLLAERTAPDPPSPPEAHER